MHTVEYIVPWFTKLLPETETEENEMFIMPPYNKINDFKMPGALMKREDVNESELLE